MVYLLHFDRPYKHARHYMGYADDVEARMGRHLSGNGARLIQVIQDAGIGWTLVRVWEGDRHTERSFKDQHNAPRLCPICNPGVDIDIERVEEISY